MLQSVAVVVAWVATVVAVAAFVRGVVRIYRKVSFGRPAPERLRPVGARLWRTVTEVVSHRHFRQRPGVRVAHWFVMVSFVLLFFTLLTGYGQLTDPAFALPLIGHWAPWNWVVEIVAWAGLVSIGYLVVVRQRTQPRTMDLEQDPSARRSRFFGSTRWQAYVVEAVIAAVILCVLVLRGLEYAHLSATGRGELATAAHFPLTGWLGELFAGASAPALADAITVVALVKILVSLTWLTVVGLQPSMGVAWHRFLALVNVFARRRPEGGPALGAAEPIVVDGRPFTLEAMEDLPEDTTLGIGSVEQFSWKALLDFSTCTECGRCQDQCPAWNTGKPLSPKLLTIALRDHAAAAAPFVRAARAGGDDAAVAAANAAALEGRDGFTPHTGDVLRALATSGAAPAAGVATTPGAPLVPDVVDPDVLWSCTTCGACVHQCPVDIEHVDHILGLRRHEVLMASAFPDELGGLFTRLEGKGNPWGMSARKRLEWAKDLDFDVPVVGEDVEDLSGVDYLFWVGCAGAYDDRAKKTTRAVAELLHTAGVSFAVLGNGETCTGDPARRAGNELVFQMLAAQNVETLEEAGARRIVVTCAHCFNTIANEYPQLGGTYEVLHHTQLLNRLVRDGRLRPVAPPAEQARTITYHDPCYLGRHNQVYAPPRELLGALPGAELVEMPRHGETSFCCGGGGARMWAEERIGTRINVERAREAAATGADAVATACPYCTIMLGDGTAANGDDVEVVDVAQMLLAGVRRARQAGPTEQPGSA